MARRAIPSVHLIVGGIDMTYEAENLTWSNADPGGYEMASFSVQVDQANLISPGSPVLIKDGIQTIWQGRVSEPSKQIKHGWNANKKTGAITTRISCEGSGAALKDNNMSMIYIDRDISRWQSWSVDRQLTLVQVNGFNTSQFSWEIGADSSNGLAGIVTSTQGPLTGLNPIMELVYDSGPLNSVSRIRYIQDNTNFVSTDTNVETTFFTASTLSIAEEGVMGGTYTKPQSSVSFDVTSVPALRYCMVQMLYALASTATAGTAGLTYAWTFQNIQVIGNHGLTLRNASDYTNAGYYVSDIAAHAVGLAIQQGANMKLGQIDVVNNYVVPHYVQYDPIPHDNVLQDMAQIGPAHYGVWASDSIFDDIPTFTFRNYTSDPTVFCSLSDCDEADVSERLANLYTSAEITYQDAAGTEYAINVSLPNSVLEKVNIQRTTLIDLGLSSTQAAETFAVFALQALFLQARTAGTVQVTAPLKDRNGVAFPAYWIRAGIDRLRINDLPERITLLPSYDNDSMRVSRIESQMNEQSGDITSRIELDSGPNLIETLQARVQIADQLVGF